MVEPNKMRRFMLAGIVVASMCQPASSATFIRCKSSKDGVVTITLNAMKKFSSSLNCISGNFVVDLTPCAPNGGFGLSYPTGSASLSGVVKRWQDYGNHLGGVTGNRIDRSSILFKGVLMSPGAVLVLGRA